VKRNLLLATALFAVSIIVGTLAPPELFDEILNELMQLLGPVQSLGTPALLLFIFLNNAIKALIIIVLGILLGLPPLLFVAFNGFTIGVVISGFKSVAGWEVVAAALAPHGVIEVPLLLLATALGFTVGRESWRWLIWRRSEIKQQLRRGLRFYLRWILGGLLIAAVIEVFVTPYFIHLAGM